jgi:hypothetical protein
LWESSSHVEGIAGSTAEVVDVNNVEGTGIGDMEIPWLVASWLQGVDAT